ncbi:MAG: transcription factor [Candidatus Bathyarchaeia archaeon]
MSFLEEEMLKVASRIGGEDAVKIVHALRKLGEATDDAIANETGIKLNDVRKILYKLYDCTLVSSTRVRDSKTGWFLFYWKLEMDQLDAFIRSRKRRVLERLKDCLEYQQTHEFFECPRCNSPKITFEEAIESAFRCTRCGEQLRSVNKEKIVSFLSSYVKKLEDELNE